MADCYHCHKKITKSDLVVSMMSSIGTYYRFSKECLAFHYSCFENIAGSQFAAHFHKNRNKTATVEEVVEETQGTTCYKKGCHNMTRIGYHYCLTHSCTCQNPKHKHGGPCQRVRYSTGIAFCQRCK